MTKQELKAVRAVARECDVLCRSRLISYGVLVPQLSDEQLRAVIEKVKGTKQ